MQSGTSPTRLRTLAFWALTVLLVLGLLGSITAIWANARIQDSETWAQTVAPLADNPSIQDFVVSETETIINNKLAADENAGRLESATRSSISAIVHMALVDFVHRPEFPQWWEVANYEAHNALVTIATGDEGSVLAAYDGKLVLELQPIVDYTNARLTELLPSQNYTITLPEGSQQIVLLSSDAITQVMGIVDLVDMLAIILPLITVLCFVGAIIVAPDRMLGLLRVGASVMVGMVIVLVALSIGHDLILNNVSATSRDAVDALVQILLQDFTLAIRAAAAVGLLIVVRVLALRYLVARKTKISAFINQNRTGIVLTIVGAAIATMLVMAYPPAWLSMVLLAVIVFGIVTLWMWREREVLPA